jgi:alpha-amylase/alpha-mannosidase (GH57 family)
MSAEVGGQDSVTAGREVAMLDVVLCWHMHQPQYREPLSGQYQLPWTYLHALKDYADMVAHLENAPEARVVVNFAPILLEQIAEYAEQLAGICAGTTDARDPVLNLLVREEVPAAGEARAEIIRWCLRAHAQRMIEPFPLFRDLARIARAALEDRVLLERLASSFFLDLATCYHLAWCGETVRRQYPELQNWVSEGRDFNSGERKRLLEIMSEVMASIIPRYRALAERRQIELSFSPYAHPIMPLLLDLESTREAMPEAMLPQHSGYPGGRERVLWHLERGREVFQHHFKLEPGGCWPSEGGVSDETLKLLDGFGLRWTATGQTVLANSLRAAPDQDVRNGQGWLHRPYRLPKMQIRAFFRDDGLSDSIGFRYADWHADDAVADFVHHLENILESNSGGGVVSVILDGENAWEYYPDNGFHFLNGLYAALTAHPRIRMRTFSEVCEDDQYREVSELPSLVAGSWVYGTFSTWIGDPDKNAGWDRLVEAKLAVDAALRENAGSGYSVTDSSNGWDRSELAEQLAVCEGSDWCWWFGGYNPAGSVSDFEMLYRQQLASLYHLARLEVPGSLSQVLSAGGGAPAAGGTMRPGQVNE